MRSIGAPRPVYQRRRKPHDYPSLKGVWLAVAVLAAAVGFVAFDGAPRIGVGCNIKGNISKETGERIFHVKGQRYYSETNIRPLFGERWFCSEEEARKAGWRKFNE